EHRKIKVRCPTFARCNSSHHLRAIGDCLRGMERSFSTREALDDQPCFFIYQNAHGYALLASATTFSAASAMPSATVKLNPDSSRILRPNSTLVPSIRITIGTPIFKSRAAASTPVAKTSQRRMPPKILINTAFTDLSDNRIRKAFLICSALAPPP